jgi:hypothetical protein
LKHVVSVSLGSSKRDHKIVTELLGEQFEISRVGTDGDFDRAIELLRELDGKVDAIGLGGIDVYLVVKEKRYAIKDGLRLMEAVKTTPVVDGSGLKNTLEREAVRILAREHGLLQKGTRVLLASSVDRFGMAEAMAEMGCNTTFGDLIFAIGIPLPIHTMRTLKVLATILLPIITQMSFHKIYPTGKKQDTQDEVKVKKYAQYFLNNQVIAGDFHLIRRYIPDGLQGQIILTNTTTKSDVENFLRTHPLIKDAQVVGVPSEKYGQEVMAFIRVNEEHTLTAEEVRNFCKGKIASWKIPRHIIFVNEYPTTTSGKVQKSKLREMAKKMLDRQGSH